ncbi:polyprenyl diphosphate synthase [Lysobacter soyae]|uniref:Ditrans,polycis-undecaprenyl-diphosphate synthase ((2E,6E)-farnesyl-diphosphate specific) n=1 Tax=Lysobacter soyae TaxID=2764185 RepID=A0ABX8WPF2_9GAMM|nr:polyprenyl diphosphate synthase [Lysobacter sp. CJ11]QYR52489.1 di-trans,poly-cis-decaprenylcistransferase [Lysobacter sp. CJ11]
MNTPNTLPRHVAVIMDGNGRWAQQRRRPRIIGHRAGARAVRNAIDYCMQQGVEVLTLYAFSSENWRRPEEEVSGLMRIFLNVLDTEVSELSRRGVRIRFIGDRAAFSESLRARMQDTESATADNTQLTLVIAASYGGHQDIAQAARVLAQQVADGQLRPEQVDAERMAQHVAMSDLQPVDLCIRTGGDLRISNFLLWQIAYSELWFTPVLWPDVDAKLLSEAFSDFARRQRRFGMTGEQIDDGAGAAFTP